jgi:hypothetical protein
MFLLVTLCAMNFAIWHYRIQQRTRDEKRVKELLPYGVIVTWNSDGVRSVVFDPQTAGSRLSDMDIHLLRELRNVWALDLRQTDVTDAGIDELAGMHHLRFVLLPASVSPEGVNDLKRQLPNATVGRSPF